jgi:hypothetical protein
MATSNFQRLLLAFTLLGCACTNAYCQSGPKSGSQCYSEDDVREQEEQRADQEQK